MNTAPRHIERTTHVDRFQELVGKKIRELRNEAGTSQQDLANACGLTKATVGHAEDGRTISLPTLVLLAYELDAAVDDLISTEAIDALRGQETVG